jgi:hypothetical protein
VNRATLLLLAILVAGLGYFAWREVRHEEQAKKDEDVRLFEGVDPARVKRFLVENLERNLHLAFERDARGRWRMVEPMDFAADQNVVGHLYDLLIDRRAPVVPEAQANPKELHLEPPRVILQMEVDVDGKPQRTRVDVGALDLDGAHLFVRANGRVLRTWRDIDTALNRSLEGYMSRDITRLAPDEVVEIHRTGSLVRTPGTKAADLRFDALLDDGVWRATAPVTAPLDPQAAGLYVQGICALHGGNFADFGKRLLSDFGLDPPEMTLTLSTVSARTLVLRFGRTEHFVGGEWHCILEGEPTVWIVDPAPVEYFDTEVELLIDPNLTRLPTAAVDGLSLALDGRELRLWHEKTTGPPAKPWMVSERPAADAAFTPGAPADAHRVEDLLGRVAKITIGKFLPGETLAETEVRGTIVVQAGDQRAGGRIGADAATAEKGRAVRFQRSGDSIAGIVDPEILDVLKTPMDGLLSLLVVELTEIEQAELELAGAGVTKRYVHGTKGLWTPPDVPFEARELRDVLDALMIVRATRHLGTNGLAPLEQPIEVTLKNLAGTSTTYTIGLAPGAAEGEKAEVDRGGRRSVLKDQGLHERLMKILQAH